MVLASVSSTFARVWNDGIAFPSSSALKNTSGRVAQRRNSAEKLQDEPVVPQAFGLAARQSDLAITISFKESHPSRPVRVTQSAPASDPQSQASWSRGVLANHMRFHRGG